MVLQPFLSSVRFQMNEGQADLSVLASDCIHLSPDGNRQMAIALWNNMLQRVGQKTSTSVLPVTDISCPTDQHPYFYTAKNSLRSMNGSELNYVCVGTFWKHDCVAVTGRKLKY